MALSPSDFGKAVVAAGLLPADDLSALWASSAAGARPKDAAALAKLLVERGALTRYQADELVAGRGPGLVLGDYIVQDKIGAGGMGQVLKAEHRKMGRTVALKLMSASAMKDEAAIKRFHREVRAAARLEHVNIVTAHAAGEARGMHYLVMQYVEGVDLSGRVKKEGPLPIDLAMDCICQSARGLAYAHSEGIIHRDIKPANLLLDKKGVVKILDMGLARIDGGDAHDGLTGTEQVLGTVDYMSPEQAISTRDCDARSDIYSLGCTLWYLLTGAKMYTGDSAIQRLMQHREAPLPSLLAARDDIPWALEKLLHKMVAKQPGDRCQTMGEVVQEIEHIRGGPESSRTSALDEDTNLGQFFKTLGGKGSSPLGTKVKAAIGKSSAEDGDTQDHSDSSKVHKSIGGQNPPWKNPKVLAGAGAAAVLLLLFGVWVIVRDKDGKPIAKVNVPDGGSVEVKSRQPNPNEPVGQSNLPGAKTSSISQTEILTSPNYVWSEPEIIGQGINSPSISDDGLMLLDASNREGGLGKTDLWMFERKSLDEPFNSSTNAENLGPAINSDSDDRNPWLSTDGLTLLFCSDRPGGIGGPDLWLATRKSRVEAFGVATNMGQPVNTGAGELGGALSEDGLTLVFSSSQNGSLGGLDLWQTRRKDLRSPFEKPQNLGPMVNSTISESHPWLSADGRVLLFGTHDTTKDESGKARRISGSGDLWMAVRPSVDAPFAERQKLAPPITVPGADNGVPSVTADGKLMFFNSKRPGSNRDGQLWVSRRVPRATSVTSSNDPAFQAWMKDVAAMKPAEQVQAVKVELMKRNPGFDGKLEHKLDKDGVVRELEFVADNVTDISPTRALIGLHKLVCSGKDGTSQLADLSPLKDLELTYLNCAYSKVSDLSPLKGMKLTLLACWSTNVSDLSPLKGMPLHTLSCAGTQISDLAPLKGMKLYELRSGHLVSDLSPLKGIPLVNLECDFKHYRDVEILRSIKTLERINAKPAAEFWKEVDAQQAAFDAWVTTVAAMKAEQQLEAVKTELMKRNPGFNGTMKGWFQDPLPSIKNGAVTELGFATESVTDISPVRALPKLQKLECYGGMPPSGKLTDLSPLTGLPLISLGLDCNKDLSDLSPLRGMSLRHLGCARSKVFDLSPLPGMPLESLYIYGTAVTDLAPLRGMKLRWLHASWTNVSDLSALKDMPLTKLNCDATKVTDLLPLHDCKSLQTLTLTLTKVTPAGVAALQKALLNCKIEWDDPAKATTTAKPITNINAPGFQQWMKDVAAMTAENQVESVSKKLQELNPGFDGKVAGRDGQGAPKIENGVVTEFGFSADDVTDISPVRALVGLKALYCFGSGPGKCKLFDLSPLSGLPITKLDCHYTQVSDLSPLQGMPFTYLHFGATPVSDLSALKAMPLTYLNCNSCTRIVDLSPLAGMPLTQLDFAGAKVSDVSLLKDMPLEGLGLSVTQVSDLSPLENCKSLKFLRARSTNVTPAGVAALQKALPNCKIEWDEPAKPITTFNDPAFQQWMKTTAALSADKQVEAVAKKLQELNPGFDGIVTGWYGKGAPKIENSVVIELGFVTDNVTDISPVRALLGLKSLWCTGSSYTTNSKLSDLSPLAGMKLLNLAVAFTLVSDLSPLRGMPLESLSCSDTPVSDLSPLQGIQLTVLHCTRSRVSDLLPLQGMKLATLACGLTRVSDLSPLQGMPLTDLNCSRTSVSDLTPLKDCKSLKTLHMSNTKVTPAGVAALQNALPNCKIEWDGAISASPAGEAAKPTTQEPASNVDPDRRAAEWVLAKGGGIGIVVDGTLKYINDELLPGISADKVLPKSPFQLQRVILIHKRDVVDADLIHLKGLANVSTVLLHGTSVTAVGLQHLQTLPKLNRVGFGNGTVDDAALTALSQLKQLTFLELLAGTRITPVNVQALKAIPNLIYLNLGYNELETATFVRIGELTKLKSLGLVASRFNESDLEKLKTLTDLDELTCSGTQLSDAGLIRLGTFKKLTRLNVKGTKITPAGVAALQEALPICKIEWDGATPPSPAGEGAQPKTPLPAASSNK